MQDDAGGFEREDTHTFVEELRDPMEQASDLLRALASPNRLLILCLLMERERTVTEIRRALGLRQSLVSQHLARLRLDGLVKATRYGSHARYALTDNIAKDIITVLQAHYLSEPGSRD